MKFPSRRRRGILLLVITMLITLSSLTPLAVTSSHLAHRQSGECTGNCDLDGCSPEARRHRTCCCWQKKLRIVAAKRSSHGCCPTMDHGDETILRQTGEDQRQGEEVTVVIRCGDPCGSRHSIPLLPHSNEYVPPPATVRLPVIGHGTMDILPFSPHWDSRDREPPDPPPRLLS